jgi:hypothetical protein
MEAMYIDGEPLSNFDGRLVDWNYEKSLTNSILTGKDYALPSLLRSEVAQGTLNVTIHVTGRNTADAHLRASQLVCRLNKTTDLQMPDGMIYRSALTKATQTDFTRWIVELSLEFTSVPHGPYVLIDPYVSGTPIYYDGTAPAGMKIEFDAPNDIQNMTLKIVKNLETKFGTSVKFSDAVELYRALISGNTSQTVTHQGKNLFDGVLQQGAWMYADGNFTGLNATYLSNKNKINVLGGNVYTLSFSTTKNVFCGFVFYNNGIYVNSSSGETSQKTFTVPSNANQIGFNLHCLDGLNSSDVSQIQLELGSTATAYVPFVPESPSVDYPAPITGVTKITVNGVDYALPRELFTDDYYDPISGQGLAHKSKKTLPTTGWTKSGFSTDQYLCAYVPDSSVKADSVVVSEKLASGKYTEGELKEEIGSINGSAFNICILASRLPSNDIAGLQAFLASNPIEVVYYAASPQPITGTPIPSTVPADTLISVDNGGTVTTTSGNTQQDIQLTSIPSGAHIVLNGIEKIITQNGSNKFADTNLVDFPALEPSETAYAVQVSKPVSNLSVGYYPTYI